jgi:hypothetical protein
MSRGAVAYSLVGVCPARTGGRVPRGGERMYLLLIVLAVVVLALVLGGIGYSRRSGSQNTTIIEE